jgi:hypothetical protein
MRTIGAACIIGFVMLAAPRPLLGLECLEIPLATAIAKSDIVLHGRVTATRWALLSPITATHSVVTIEVRALWKGSTPRQIHLYQPIILGGIDYHHAIGEEFVIFGQALTPQRVAQAFSLNPPIDQSGFTAFECITKRVSPGLLRELGEGRLPVDPPPLRAERNASVSP